MKKIFFIQLFVFAFCIFSVAQNENGVSKKMTLKGINAINISNTFDLFIKQGETESIEISASEEEYRDKIKISINNGELNIRYDNRNHFWLGWNTDRLKLKAVVSVKNIEKLTASGACDIYFTDGIVVENFAIRLSGASDINGKVTAKNLNVSLSGASDILLTGSATNLKVDASGASDFKGFNLTTEYCNSKASGASTVNVWVGKELTANASGASTVRYMGKGLIRDIKTSGASSISRKG